MAGATIIFCDIVGFSEYNNDEQRELIYNLNGEVSHELYPHLFTINPTPNVISLPTGDGMAVALLDSGQYPWRRVLFPFIDRLMHWGLRKAPLRIGVHSGVVSVIADINHRPNVCGSTINVCQRIMDAAAPNQVLFSNTAYSEYVGNASRASYDAPFSKKAPAYFKGPISIVAKHGLSIPVYIMHRPNMPGWTQAEPYHRGVIQGKITRTSLIVDRLGSLLREKHLKLTIYEQAAFSTFGITTEGRNEDPKYDSLLLRQKEILNELVQQNRAKLFLIVSLMRVQRRAIRTETLLNWLNQTQILNHPDIDCVSAMFEGPNRLVVADQFSIEGYKLHDTASYEMSIVHTEKHKIRDDIDAFWRVFQQAKENGQTKVSLVQTLRASCP